MDSNAPDKVTFNRQDIVQVLAYLDILVVSLDRMGSACCDMDKAECLENLDAFLNDWKALALLAQARRRLSEPFSTELEDDEMDELERELQHIHYWRLSAKKPPDGFIESLLSSNTKETED